MVGLFVTEGVGAVVFELATTVVAVEQPLVGFVMVTE